MGSPKPPSPFCWKCRAQDVDWVEHDGNGTVYSFTIIRHAVIPNVAEALPFVAAVVELPDTNACRLIGNIVVGIVGAVVAGWLFPFLWVPVGGPFIGTIINAVIGSIIVLFVLGLLKRA